MRNSTLSLLMALMTLFSLKASAAEALTEVNFVPDPKVVQSSLSAITVQFMEAQWGISPQVDVSGITLTRKDSPEMLYALPDPTVDYARLTLRFGYKGDTDASTVTTEGIYLLHIPQGAVTTMDGETPCSEINVDFTVGKAATPMSAYTLAPEAGQVDEISTIDLSFPEAKDLDWFYKDLYGNGTDLSDITLTRLDDPSVRYTAVKKKYDGLATITLAFTPADGTEETTITDPGVYVLDIPAGMFQKDFSTIRNEQITVEYTVGKSDPKPSVFAGMIAQPADGSSVGRIGRITLIFPNMKEGLEYPITDIARATITTPAGETFYGFTPSLGSAEGGSYNRLEFGFAPEGSVSVDAKRVFTSAGVYRINLPEGMLKAYGRDDVNAEINLSVTVDPMLDFACVISPSQDVFHQAFGRLTLSCGNNLKTIALNPDRTGDATVSLGGTTYRLSAAESGENTVLLTPPEGAEATEGDWTVKIPAGWLQGLNQDGTMISNVDEITSVYRIRKAQTFPFVADPVDGAEIEFFKNFTLMFDGADLRQTGVDEAAGQPELTGADGSAVKLTARLSGNYVIFSVESGVEVTDGEWRVSIPAGYVYTVDRNGLRAAVDAVESRFTVSGKHVADYSDGILFLNEGWFGHDPGSFNFLSADGDWTYDAFARNNHDHCLGVTSQYGQCFGDRIYVVSKQPGGENDGDGGVFTVVNARTMEFESQIMQLPDDQSEPRAFCAWDSHKGYLSCKNRIYAVDLDRMEVLSVIEGTDVFTRFDSNGEMLRYGDRVFAVRQSSGVDAIDPLTDNVTKIPAELAVAFAVTPDGSLYVATRNESNEFIKISPSGLKVESQIDIPGDRMKIADVWTTWRKAPLAADLTANVVYYVTQKAVDESGVGARSVARYDFDKGEFTEVFIKLPGTADGEEADWVLYGEGISVDPATGYILLTAVEAGYGEHYSRNRLFVADPVTGMILNDRSQTLRDGYWFPAMALYPDFQAPEIDVNCLSLADRPDTFDLDLAAVTTLPVGNLHLVKYSAKSLDEGRCAVVATEVPGVFTVEVKTPGSGYSIELTAEYQGKSTTEVIESISTGVDMTGDVRRADVFNMQGIRVLRDATETEINRLPAGIYISGGRKYVVVR